MNIEKLAKTHCIGTYQNSEDGERFYFRLQDLEAFAKALQSSEPVIKYVGTTKDTNENVHPNDDEPRCDDLIELMRRMGNDTGQGLHPYWKWAMATGFNAAKRIYKNAHPPASVPLEKYNKMLDAFEEVDRKAQAGLCYFDLNTVREFHKDIRRAYAQAIAEAEGKEG